MIDVSTMEKLWDSHMDSEKKKLVMQAGLTPSCSSYTLMEIKDLVKPKEHERLVSLLIASDTGMTMPLAVFGNRMFKRNVPMLSRIKGELLQKHGAKVTMSLLCVAEGFIVYIQSPNFGTQFNPIRWRKPLSEAYRAPTILKGVVKTSTVPPVFTTQDVVMFDGRWLLHLPLKVRKEFFQNGLSRSYKSFKLP